MFPLGMTGCPSSTLVKKSKEATKKKGKEKIVPFQTTTMHDQVPIQFNFQELEHDGVVQK
jgi:hypothetical protein